MNFRENFEDMTEEEVEKQERILNVIYDIIKIGSEAKWMSLATTIKGMKHNGR